jgi:hypothetical protein
MDVVRSSKAGSQSGATSESPKTVLTIEVRAS